MRCSTRNLPRMRSPTMSASFLHRPPIPLLGARCGELPRVGCSYCAARWHSSTRKSRPLRPRSPSARRRPDRGPERKRQQFLLRRLIAVGRRRRLPDPAGARLPGLPRGALGPRPPQLRQDIGTIMQESEQRGKEFFDGSRTAPARSSSLRAAVPAVRERLAVPAGPGREPRRARPDEGRPERHDAGAAAAPRRARLIVDDVDRAAADAERADAIETITDQMGSLYASDVL